MGWDIVENMGVHKENEDIIKRLRRASGHLNKVVEMLEDDTDCMKIAQQLQAVSSAIITAKKTYIHDHVEHCLSEVKDRKAFNDKINGFKEILMKRLSSFFMLFIFALNIVGCGFESSLDGKGNHTIQSVAVNGYSIATMSHDCPYPDNNHYSSDQPCDADCRHHGHCYCVFLATNTNLSCPTLDSSNGMRVGNFYPDPQPRNLFRPPIV